MLVAWIFANVLNSQTLQTCAILWLINFAVLSVLWKAHQSCDSLTLACLPAGHLVSRSADKVTLRLDKFPLDVLCDVVGFFDHVNELKCDFIKDPQQVCAWQCLYDSFRCHSLIIECGIAMSASACSLLYTVLLHTFCLFYQPVSAISHCFMIEIRHFSGARKRSWCRDLM